MASALLVTMVLGGILCLSVMYYLSLIQQQNTLSVRSQAWNLAIAITEAGIEDGLQMLNSKATDGWTKIGTFYCRTNTLPDGNWYTVTTDNASDPKVPVIIARSYVGLPALAINTPSVLFAVIGPNPGSYLVSRAVRVTCYQGSMFHGAMVAKRKIDLKGNGILTDSFDSENLWKSNFGQYDASVYAGDEGNVASNDGVVSTISVQNARIYGKAHVGAEGTVAIGGGAVGKHDWQNAGNTGAQPGYVLQDAHFDFPTTGLPYSTGLPLGAPQTIVTVTYDYNRSSTSSTTYPNPPPWSGVTTNSLTITQTTVSYPEPGTYLGSVTTNYLGATGNIKDYTYNLITGTSYTYNLYTTNTIYRTNVYDHVITSGNYYTTDDMHGSIIVTGDAQLVLPNGLSMSGTDQITIAPGGSLKMFVDGSECTIGGNGIINQSGYAWDFRLECTPNVKTFTLNGNGEFIGVLVAPEADMTMNGGGKSNNDFIGSLMMKSVGMNGHFGFHYDEALSRKFPNPRLLVKSWNEIP